MGSPILKFGFENGKIKISEDFLLPKYTILVGKNNIGKSLLLQELYRTLQESQEPYEAYYISPERFGGFERNSSLEDRGYMNRLAEDKNKLDNQSAYFISDAISNFNGLIGRLLRSPSDTKSILDSLLEHLNNKVVGLEFSYTNHLDNTPVHFKINGNYFDSGKDKFSSGTIQIIALMMSVMYFLYSNKYTKNAVLLLDEPDVHIHSDLQYQFIKFLISVIKDKDHKVFIATHSSSIISGFENEPDAYIATKKVNSVEFLQINDSVRDILPALGAHSLSYVFNKAPLLLIEGGDDFSVWNHAIRKSKGKIKFHLVEVGGVSHFTEYENLISSIAPQLFDNPKAFEIRDADLGEDGKLKKDLADVSFLKRSYLNCREIENLILSNEVLKILGVTSWEEAIGKIQAQPRYQKFDRYTEKIDKEYELIGFLSKENSKSWEQLVGEAIGNNISKKDELINVDGSIFFMLGSKISNWIS